MGKFGLSAAVAVMLAAPAWAYDPPPLVADAVPPPAGYPLPSLQPAYYPSFAEGAPPATLPPVAPPPSNPMNAAPGQGMDPQRAADPYGFPFDPRYGSQCDRCPRIANEYWVRGDWLYWNFRNMPVPPLIVTGNPSLPGAGIPGGGNAIALVGPNNNYPAFNGVRATIGQWFDPDGELGAEVSGFIFARQGTSTFFQGSPTLPLSVPVLGSDGTLGVYDFSFPGRFTGGLGVRTANQLLGAEANLLHRWYSNRWVNIDGILGYRYLNMHEDLGLYGQTRSAGAIATFAGQELPQGVTLLTADTFRTNTQFHGGQIGARIEARRDMFTVTAYGKGGVGANIQTLHAEGTTTATGFGITKTAVGGLRVFPSNFGRATNTDFSMIGETGVEFGLQVTNHVCLRVGYNLLFWSDVLRPSNVISPVVTFSQVPIDPTFSTAVVPHAQPTTVFRSSDFLAHGLVVGALVEW